MIYEGYGPHGIAVLVETATDNTNRTVASVRMYFNKYGGTLGTSGSVGFMFEHKCVFKFKPTEGHTSQYLLPSPDHSSVQFSSLQSLSHV